MTIYSVEGIVHPDCSKSHIVYRFPMLFNCRKLHFLFRYSPKNLEDREEAKRLIQKAVTEFHDPSHLQVSMDKWESYLPLKNLLTFSVDDPNKQFRGAAHRHDPEQHLFIGHEEASPGLIPGDLPQGMWEITISLHVVVTPSCHYWLEVYGE